MKKIRVLHLITRFLKWGGAEKNTYRSMKALTEDPEGKYEVELSVGRENNKSQLKKVREAGIKTHELSHLVNPIHPGRDLSALFELYVFLKRGNYDVIHTHQTKASILGRVAAKAAGIPVIIYGVHGSTFSGIGEPLRSLLLALERYTARFTDRFVSVGKDLRDRFLEQGIGSREAFRIVRSAMDLEPFYEAGQIGEEKRNEKRLDLGLEPSDLVIGKVASLEPRKGHEYVLEVAAKLTDKYDGLKFLFVGEGEERSKLKARVDDMRLSDRVLFSGYREDIAEVMGVFDIFTFTSLREGLPQVLIQAVAVGLPIVTFNVEGACEVVKDGENGYIVPLRDVEALEEKLEKLIRKPDLRKKIGGKGSEILGDEWGIDKMKEDTINLYDEILSQRGWWH